MVSKEMVMQSYMERHMLYKDTNKLSVIQEAENLIMNGEYDKAEKYLLKAVSLNPSEANPYNYLGVIYYQRGRFEESRKMFARSLELKANEPTIMRYEGAALQMLGKQEEARLLYQKAAELDKTAK